MKWKKKNPSNSFPPFAVAQKQKKKKELHFESVCKNLIDSPVGSNYKNAQGKICKYVK